MGRNRTGRIRTTFMVDEDLYAKLQVFLTDPKSGRMRYGAIQSILNELLSRFMSKLLQPDTDTIAMLKAYGVKFDELDELDALDSSPTHDPTLEETSTTIPQPTTE